MSRSGNTEVVDFVAFFARGLAVFALGLAAAVFLVVEGVFLVVVVVFVVDFLGAPRFVVPAVLGLISFGSFGSFDSLYGRR